MDRLAAAQLAQQTHYNKKGVDYRFRVGAVVKLRREPALGQEGSDRVMREYETGWVVHSYLGSDVYRISHARKAMRVVNGDKLLPQDQHALVRVEDIFDPSARDTQKKVDVDDRSRKTQASAVTGEFHPSSSSTSSSASAADPVPDSVSPPMTGDRLSPAMRDLNTNLHRHSKKELVRKMEGMYPGCEVELNKLTLPNLRRYIEDIIKQVSAGKNPHVRGANKKT